MSALVQRSLLDRQCYGSRYRSPIDLSRNPFVRTVYADEEILQRMTLYKELEAHQGCVNSLYWSRGGDKLLSGSDDFRLCVWMPFDNYRLAYTIETGHRANIFSAKFIPHTSDSVIVSAAGDAEVRVFDVNASSSGTIENGLRQVYTCHSDRVKRIGLDEARPNEFLTCSEDGTVRHFDLRRPHKCSAHSIRSSITASRRPARQYPAPVGDNVRDGCPSPLLDYGRYGVDINTLSMNKLHPQYFAVAGTDEYLYLHDRRMPPGGGGAGKNGTWATVSKCVRRFSTRSEQRTGSRRRNGHVTACKFSDANGQELLGSWSSDGIYLFNMHDSPKETAAQATLRQTSRVKRNLGDVLDHSSEMDLIMRLFKVGDLDQAMDELHDVLSEFDNAENNVESDDDNILRKVWGFCMEAAIQIRRIYERGVYLDTSPGSDYFAGEALASARRHMQEAVSIVPNTWQGYWCLAVGYWIASGGDRNSGCEDRQDWLMLAQMYAEKAQNLYMAPVPEEDPFETAPHRSTRLRERQQAVENKNASDSCGISDCRTMMKLFIKDVRKAKLREGYSDTEDMDGESDRSDMSDESAAEPRWKWLDFMYKKPWVTSSSQAASKQLSESESGPSKRQRNDLMDTESENPVAGPSEQKASTENEDSNEVTEMDAEEDPASMNSTTSTSDDSDDADEDEEDDDDDDDDESDRGTVGTEDIEMHIETSDEYDEDSDDNGDDDWIPRCHHIDRQNMESGTDIVSPRSRYVGHCNVRTVKDVNFYGLNDEYVVSGSDDGYVFVWDKKTEKIVQILHGDEDTVNVIQGHPKFPVMAVSGIDNTVKIFSPTAGPGLSYSHMYEKDTIVARNQERVRGSDADGILPRHVIAAISATIRRRQRMQRGGVQGDDNEDENGSDEGGAVECHMQ
ncbi:hypothetical protein EC973_004403 [Apophysomyces ossiformis]|uniref:Uncharacterized protein n=1 Tax=Apophysomyces ossiformis TaxID=679940 RepID=A0A8H7BXD7_9FUNG|nr:hypothetical protein EC973_004403 [Apophysomyces ossiformis]